MKHSPPDYVSPAIAPGVPLAPGKGGHLAGIASEVIPTYEDRLSQDARWALSEGSRHFEGKSDVFRAFYKITKRLAELGIPCAIVGGMSLFQHGLRRFTEDVDILVTKDDLRRIHEKLEGLGYLPVHLHSKHLRDTEFGVRIEFLTTGEFPGPRSVSFESDGVSHITLPALIELKLASGMTNPTRLKDLADVLELIKLRNLSADYAEQLNPFVRDKYRELCEAVRKYGVVEESDFDPDA